MIYRELELVLTNGGSLVNHGWVNEPEAYPFQLYKLTQRDVGVHESDAAHVLLLRLNVVISLLVSH